MFLNKKPQNDVRSRAFSLVYPYCNGPNDIIVSDSYKCVLQISWERIMKNRRAGLYDRTFSERKHILSTSIKDCTIILMDHYQFAWETTWSCAKVVVTPTPHYYFNHPSRRRELVLWRRHGIPPPNGTECDSTSGVKGTFQGVCAVYHCPNGCASDGKMRRNFSGIHINIRKLRLCQFSAWRMRSNWYCRRSRSRLVLWTQITLLWRKSAQL